MKAVVVKIKGNNAVLLLDDGQFIMTRNHDYTIGEEINKIKKSSYQTRFLTLAASAAVFVIILAAGVFAFVTPAYYVSVDVNPSLVLKVNIFERLTSMEAMNDDAEVIMAGLDWKYKDVDEVLYMAFQRIDQEGKLENGGSILITAAGKNEARTAVMLAEIKEKADTFYPQDVSVQTETVGIDMVTAAKEFGLTPGKYNLITKLLGETLTNENKEMYLTLSVQELMEKFTAAKASIGEEKANDAKQNNGSENRPAEAEAYRQKADQMVSKASQKKSEAIESANKEASETTQETTEVAQTVIETLPITTNRSPAESITDSDDEITHPPVETPTDTLVDGPDTPNVPDLPDVPASTAEQNIPAANDNRP